MDRHSEANRYFLQSVFGSEIDTANDTGNVKLLHINVKCLMSKSREKII